MDGEAWCATVHGIQRIKHDWETELNWVVHKFYFFLVQSGRLNIYKNLFSFRLSILLSHSVQSLSCVLLFVTTWITALQDSVHQQLPEFTQTHVHWVGDAIQPSHTLASPSPSVFNLSRNQGLFEWVSSSHRWPKCWSLSFNISASNEHPRLMFFRMDWLDLLAVQGILKSLLQHHSSKTSIVLHSAFFIVQLSNPYMTTGKTIALTRWTFVAKVMSLLFNMLSRLVITILPRSKHLLISWLQSPSAVILVPRKIKSATVSPSIYHEVMGPDAMIFIFWMLSFKPTFSLSSFTFIKRLFSSSLSAIRVIVFIISTIVWSQGKQQGGNTASPINRKLD